MAAGRGGGKPAGEEVTRQELEETSHETAARAGIAKPDAEAVFADLSRRYSGPGRAYHNLDHIAAMLDTVSDFGDLVHDDVAVRLAVWFHDAVYDSRRNDNEAESAHYAMAALKSGPWDSLRMRVMLLIGKTKAHEAPIGDTDCQILLDADLAILGASTTEYDRYAQAIREEYAWVPEADYRAGRKRVLGSFLERERLYCTNLLFEAREAAARANLRRELTRLTKPQTP